MMIRKQIYLSAALDRQIRLIAQSEGKPEAQVIRERLHAGFLAGQRTGDEDTGLVGLAKRAAKGGPEDLSRNLDDYLYTDR